MNRPSPTPAWTPPRSPLPDTRRSGLEPASPLVLVGAVSLAAATPVPPDLAAPLAAIRAVGPEGAGNAAASEAWRTLASRGASDLPVVLGAMAGRSPSVGFQDAARLWSLRPALRTQPRSSK